MRLTPDFGRITPTTRATSSQNILREPMPAAGGWTGRSFPAHPSQGFAGKYTPRQLDSIVAQILSIGSKAISSDYPYISGDGGRPDRYEDGRQIGHRFTVAPYVFPGWLSRQWVIGVGRSMKVTQMYVEIRAFPSDPPGATWDPANPSRLYPTLCNHGFLAGVVAASRLFWGQQGSLPPWLLAFF